MKRVMTTTAHPTSRSAEDVETNRRQLVDDLRQKLQSRPTHWQSAFIETVAAWPIANETLYGETYHYFIGGEAFNWKRLAERIATELAEEDDESPVEPSEIFDWLATSGVFGGIGEERFRRIIGVDGWRAHLNYFYGVHIEQCLIAAIQARNHKRRYSAGLPPSDESSDRAYLGLYEDNEQTLWDQFLSESSDHLSELIADSPEETRTIALDEEFTYWLFKRRIEYTLAPQVASETQRGLDMMHQIAKADERRTRMLKDQNGAPLLEFGLVKPRKPKLPK